MNDGHPDELPPPEPLLPATTWHSGMLERYGPLWTLAGLPFFFRHLRLEEHSAERVRAAAALGPVVYVLHTRSFVDWLALNHVLRGRGLPLPVYTNGIDARPWMPLPAAWAATRRRMREGDPADALQSGWLSRAVAAGLPVCVFLVPPRESWLRRAAAEPDPVPSLLEAQALTGRPVQVLPVVVLWSRAPGRARTEVERFVLGTQDHPGTLGKLVTLASGQAVGDAVVQVGAAIPLTEYAERYASEPPARRVKVLRLALRRYLYREAQVVRGPRGRPHAQVRRVVLTSPEVDALVTREAVATGEPPEVVRARVARTFDRLAARFSFPVVRIVGVLCRFLWNRIYAGLDVRPEDLDRIRDALRAGTPVLVPCHRSHLDYLLISSLLYEHDMVIPHIVAGDNLSFFPLGSIFRRCGAFFVKRSFAGERVFPVVFARYLRELVRTEVPVEFFAEGGRSRTGKMLPPKVGVFGMVMDAASHAREGREVTFLPIFLGYEQVAEEGAYVRELAGARKEKEDVRQVVKATGVLRNRYGRVYMRVGEPLPASAVCPPDEWPRLSRERRQEVLIAACARLFRRIEAEAVSLPTGVVALALLAHDGSTVPDVALRDRIDRVRAFLRRGGATEGGDAAGLDAALARFSASRAVRRVDGPHGVEWRVEGRTALDYYKNTILHVFSDAAIYAAAVRARGGARVDEDAVSADFSRGRQGFRYEFVQDPDEAPSSAAARAVDALIAHGALARDADGRLNVADDARLDEIAVLILNFVESYRLVARAAASGAAGARDLPRAALALGRALVTSGQVARDESLNLVNLENATRALGEDGPTVFTERLDAVAPRAPTP